MSTNGETADLMVREGIQITESALKLAGLGVAALLIALANDNQKLAGKTNLKRLIHDGEELTIFSVKQEDLKGFQMEAKRYGVLFYPIVNKVEKTGTVEIMAKAKDAKQINRIFERMGYPAPVKEDAAAKKENARAPSESSSKVRGTGARASTEPATEKADARPSVRSRLMALQAAAERDGTAPTKDTVREARNEHGKVRRFDPAEAAEGRGLEGKENSGARGVGTAFRRCGHACHQRTRRIPPLSGYAGHQPAIQRIQRDAGDGAEPGHHLHQQSGGVEPAGAQRQS